jgi:hypothetical protein
MKKIRYIFMVGFPRSGTTLAQTILMCDRDVFSIPETHLFTKGLKYKRLPEFLTNIWACYYCYKWIKTNFAASHVYYSRSREKLVKSFFNFIAEKAKMANKSIVLEKTPGHLNKIEMISRIFPDAEFIHITRAYSGAIPSIVKAAKQWGGNDDVFANTRRWVYEVFSSIYYASEFNNHTLVKYEDIVANRRTVIAHLNTELGLNIEFKNDADLASLSKTVVEKNEVWKSNNLTGNRVTAAPDIDVSDLMEEYVNYLVSVKKN